MTIPQIILAVVKLIILILGAKFEADEKKKKKKEKIVKEYKDGLKEKDTSAITAAFDKFKRV